MSEKFFHSQESPDEERQRTHKEMVDKKAREILISNGLPACGETRVWANEGMPDKSPDNPDNPEFSLLSWNIERGLKFEEEVGYLRKANPDILCLQEVDWNCMRTQNRNVALEIAERLGYKYTVFSTEFVELDDKDDSRHLKEFPKSKRILFKMIGRGGGVHGSAVLSRYPIENSNCIKLPNILFDWEDGRFLIPNYEPRQGQRIFQRASIKIGNRKIIIYNAHFENHYGTTGRLAQYDVVADDAEKEKSPCVIAGDFNTLSHGLLQLLPGVRSDLFNRLRGLFQSDARHWINMEFSDTPLRRRLNAGISHPRKKTFADPNDPDKPTFGVDLIYKAKLDWTLFEEKGFQVLAKEVGPKGLSDHRPLVARVKIK